VARSALRYQSRVAVKDAPILTHMRELSAQYPRFGYRRIQVFLERIGSPMSADRVHRIWRRDRFGFCASSRCWNWLA
jgi:putative transposase